MTRTEHEVLRICALAHRIMDERGYDPAPKSTVDLLECGRLAGQMSGPRAGGTAGDRGPNRMEVQSNG